MPRPFWPSENAALWLGRFRAAFAHARVPLTAAGLTFMTQLTLVLLLSHLSPHIDLLTDAFVSYLAATLFPDGSSALFADLNRFRHQAAALPALDPSSLPVVSLLFVRTIERTFGQIWHTARRRPLWKQWAYCGVLVLLPLGIGAAGRRHAGRRLCGGVRTLCRRAAFFAVDQSVMDGVTLRRGARRLARRRAARGRLKARFRHRPTGGQNPQKGRLKKAV